MLAIQHPQGNQVILGAKKEFIISRKIQAKELQ